MKFKAKSLMSNEETHSVAGRAGAYLGEGWVQGHYIDGYIAGGVIEANEDYIAIEWWIPVDIETVTPINGKLEEEIQILKNTIGSL